MYIELSNYLDTKERKIIVGMKELKKKELKDTRQGVVDQTVHMIYYESNLIH